MKEAEEAVGKEAEKLGAAALAADRNGTPYCGSSERCMQEKEQVKDEEATDKPKPQCNDVVAALNQLFAVVFMGIIVNSR